MGGLDLAPVDMLVIENVGNLVCTAGYDLGEHLRAVVLSIPEGDDKIVKYPPIFRRSDVLILTKTDLLPHIEFDVDRVVTDMKRLAPDAAVFRVCAIRGEGVGELADYLAARCGGETAG